MGCTSRAGARLAVTGLLVASMASELFAQQEPGELRVRRSGLTGSAVMVSAADRGPLPMPGVVAGGRIEPIQALAAHGRVFGVTDPARQLAAGPVRVDALGHTHATFHQVHGGVPVFSGTLRVHQNENGQPYAINGRFYALSKSVPTIPRVNADAAARAAMAKIEAVDPHVLKSELTIVDPGWYGDPPIGARLAWHLLIHDEDSGLHESFFVDAVSGKILDQWSEIHTVRDRWVHDGEVDWHLPGVLARAEGDPAVTKNPEVNQAYDYLGDTYDYFYRAFGRDSIDDQGMPLIVTVNSTAAGCPNAAWSERVKQAIFCPGTAVDDIVGHEITHGITSRTAALIYQNQPGQLNESFSDVFGELIDLFNGNAAFLDDSAALLSWPEHGSGPGTDAPNLQRQDACFYEEDFAEGPRWFVAEDAVSFGGAIRDMWSPTCFGMPDRANHEFQLCQNWDNGGVHYGSSVPNHAFTLVTDGDEFNGFTIRGIGPIKSGAVWFRALTHYLTAAADFEDAYYDLNQAAIDLIGTRPLDPRTGQESDHEFTADDAHQVDLALRATEMNSPGRCGLAFPVLDSQPPPTCGNKSVVYSEDFEGSAEGWTVTNSKPLTPFDWERVSELPSERQGSAYFIADPHLGNCFDVNESGLHSLISPPLTLPETGQVPILSFVHYIAAESGYDGGNMKLRVNDGDWQIIPGEAFLFNPYNSTLLLPSKSNFNPIAGQDAWTHAGGQWGTSVIDLRGLIHGGDRFQIRFDFGKDQCDGVEGWFVDDVEVYLCPDCNRNGRIDMQEARATFTSPRFDSVGLNTPQSFTLPAVLPAAGDVTIAVSAIADLASVREDFGITLNGVNLGRVFLGEKGRDCPREADVDRLVVPAETFNNLIHPSGPNVLEITASYEVDDHLCGEVGFVRVLFDYLPISTDANANQVPDECENCSTSVTPLPEPLQVLKNRYVSFVPNNAGRWTAIRVSALLPGSPPNQWKVYWIDAPWTTMTRDDGGVEAMVRLSCEPVFMDWSAYAAVHLGDRVIVPRGLYRIQEIDLACVPPDSPLPLQPFGGINMSGGLMIGTTSIFGDLIGGSTLLPDAQLNVLDISAAVDVLLNREYAVSLSRADMHPADPDAWVNVIDLSIMVDSWKGFPYPFPTEKECP